MEHHEPRKIVHHSKSGHTQNHLKDDGPCKPLERQKATHASRYASHLESEQLQDKSHPLPDLGRDGNYIRSWIAQIHKENDAGAVDLRAIQMQFGQSDIKQKPQRGLKVLGHRDFLLEDQPITKKCSRNSSSDSSIIEPATRLQSPVSKTVEKPAENEQRTASQAYKKRKSDLSVDSKTLGQAKYRPEIFEKQPRRKTREELYNHKKREKRDGQDEEKRIRKKREKRGDKKKAAKKAGEDLMNNFSSKSVGQERLTIRPSNGPGIFRNGRASSPAKRGGLPDLAFSEMEFLQHSMHSKPAFKAAGNGRKKAVERDKRRPGRAYEEISTFFKPGPNVLEDISSNGRAGRSSSCLSNVTTRSNQEMEANEVDSSHRPSHGFDSVEHEHLRFVQLGSALRIPLTHNQNLPFVDQYRQAIDTRSSWSGKATTCITWSETPESPTAIEEKRNRSSHPSPAPESVRRSIEMSGILNDTGISLTSELRGIRKVTSPPNDPTQSSQNTIRGSDVPITSSFASGNVESSGDTWISPNSREGLVPHQRGQLQVTRQNDIEAKTYPTNGIPYDNESAEGPVITTNPIPADHYDPVLGWHRRQDTRAHEVSQTLEAPKESKFTPVSREEIAKNSRIKRPSTILPVIRVTEASDPVLTENRQLVTPADEVSTPKPIPIPRMKVALLIEDIHTTQPTENINSAQHDTIPCFEFDHEMLPKEQCQPSVNIKSNTYQSEINQSKSSRMETNMGSTRDSTLSNRGARYGFHQNIVPPYAAWLSPIFESAPLYLNQVQPGHTTQPQPINFAECTVDYLKTQYFEGPTLSETFLALEGPEIVYFANNVDILQPKSAEYLYPDIMQLDLEVEAEFDPHLANHQGRSKLWKRMSSISREEIGDFGPGYEADYVARSSNAYPVEEYSSYNLNSQCTLDQERNEDIGLMDGFWRPQTYY